MALQLDCVADLYIAPPVIDLFVKHLVERTDQERFSFLIQVQPTWHCIEKVLRNLLFHEEIDDSAVGVGAEDFDEVEDERAFVVVVGVQESHVRIEPCDDASSLYPRVQDAISVIEQAVEGVTSRVTAPAFELPLLRHDAADRIEVCLRGHPLDAHDRSAFEVERAFHGKECFIEILKLQDRKFKSLFLVRPVLLQILQEIDLVPDLLRDPAPRHLKADLRSLGLQLAAADQRGASELRVPDATERIAVVVEEDDVDVVLHCKCDGISGDGGRGRDQDAVDLVGRYLEGLLIVPDKEAVLLLLQERSPGVNDELHYAILSGSARICFTAPNPRETDLPIPR